MNPMLAKLASQRVAAEANARRAAVGHGQALGSALQASAAPIDASYNRGIVSSAAVNDALANRLNAAGGQAQGDLSAKLAQIGAQDTGEIAQTYQGAANAGFAGGAADLQALIAERAAAGAYQGKLPGIGLLEGNRDLGQALGEMRGEFGDRQQALEEQAVSQSFDLFNQFRGEKREDTQFQKEQLAAQQELYSKEKLALATLRATAIGKAEKMRFDAQMKDLDRRNAQEIARIRQETSMYGVDVRADTAANKPVSVTGPANQPYISVQGVQTRNPNWHGTWKNGRPVPPPSQPAGGSAAQRRLKNNQAASNLRRLLLNPQTQKAKQWVANASNEDLMRAVNGAIEQAGIGPNTPDGIRQRKAILKLLGIPSGPMGNPYYPGGSDGRK